MHEPLFDTSDLKSLKSELDLIPQSPTASLLDRGPSSLEIALLYDAPMRKMTVHVLQARGIPSREKTTTHTQVRLLILPSKKQKHKTKIRSGENPQFMERWEYRTQPLQFSCLRLNYFKLSTASRESRRSKFNGIASSRLWLRTNEKRTTDWWNDYQFCNDRLGAGNEFMAAARAEEQFGGESKARFVLLTFFSYNVWFLVEWLVEWLAKSCKIRQHGINDFYATTRWSPRTIGCTWLQWNNRPSDCGNS